MGGTGGIGDGSGKLMRSSSLGQNDNQPIDSSNRAFHQIGLYLTRVAFKRRKYFFLIREAFTKKSTNKLVVILRLALSSIVCAPQQLLCKENY